MDIVQTSELLAEIQIGDNRRIDDAVLIQWHKLVGDLDYDVALEAMMLHRRESDKWLTASHIRTNVERIRLAGLGPQRDEFDNDIEPDRPAIAAYQRLHPDMKAIRS